MANTARIVRFHQVGGPEVLKVEEVPLPEPGPGELRLRVKAMALNRAEMMFREGHYMTQPVFPSGIGYEAAGIVEAVGEGADKSLLGKTMASLPLFEMTKYGVDGEVAILPAYAVTSYPANLTFEQGASIWVQYLTAYGALVHIARIKQEDFVVITAASSSVGVASIRLAKAEGAVAIATTRTAKKKDALIALGADHVIVTESEDVASRVMEITGGKGARIVFDSIAGPGVEALAMAAAPGGWIFLYGALGNPVTPLPLFPVLMKALTIYGYQAPMLLSDPAILAAAIKYIFERFENGTFKADIDKVFPLEQIVEAHRYMESNEHIGKIVVSA